MESKVSVIARDKQVSFLSSIESSTESSTPESRCISWGDIKPGNRSAKRFERGSYTNSEYGPRQKRCCRIVHTLHSHICHRQIQGILTVVVLLEFAVLNNSRARWKAGGHGVVASGACAHFAARPLHLLLTPVGHAGPREERRVSD